MNECCVAQKCYPWQEVWYRKEEEAWDTHWFWTQGERWQGGETWNFPEHSQEGLCKKGLFDLKHDHTVKDSALFFCSPVSTNLSYIGLCMLRAHWKPNTPTPPPKTRSCISWIFNIMSYILCLERNRYSLIDVTQATDLLSFTEDSASLVIFDLGYCLYLRLFHTCLFFIRSLIHSFIPFINEWVS